MGMVDTMQAFEPKNEMGVIVLFSVMLEMSGWEIVEIGAAFPDAILRKNGETWRTEFEYKASNFLTHRHDIRECDLIICWENDYPDCPLPVIDIKSHDWIHKDIKKGNPLLNEIAYWKKKALDAERKLHDIHVRKSKPEKEQAAEATLDAMLDIYRKNPKASLRSVGRQLDRSPSTISNWLDELETKGIVHRNGQVEVLS